MNYFSFMSKSKPAEIGYRVETDSAWERGDRGACRWATFYLTYGDGAVQHSKEQPFALEMLSDFLGSLASAIAEETRLDQRMEMIELVSKHWPRMENSKETIRFALSVKYDEKKIRYYSRDDRKVSESESKRHDRRWDKIGDWHDGSVRSAVTILNVGNSYDRIHAIQAWREVCDVFEEQNDGYCPVNVWQEFKLATDVQSRYPIEAAWSAVANYVLAFRTLVDAARHGNNWLRYLPKQETVVA